MGSHKMNLGCHHSIRLAIILWIFLMFFWGELCCVAQQIRDPKFIVSYNQPKKITKLGSGHYLIDFGKSFFGTVSLSLKSNHAKDLVIHQGEKLLGNRIDRNPEATVRYQKVVMKNMLAGQAYIVKLQPDIRNTNDKAIHLPDSLGVVMPFRYCEIENLQVPIEDIELFQKAIYVEFDDMAGYFSSSNKTLDQVWNLCKHTIKATTFTGYYVDGDRERIPYEADAYINQLSHYSVDDNYAIAKRTNEYFIDHPTWPTEWLLHTAMLFYQDYMYTGDLTLIRKHYQVLKVRTLHDLAREDGLISSRSHRLDSAFMLKLGFKDPKTKVRDIVDWPPAQKDSYWKLATEEGERDGYDMGVEINTVVNAFYYHNLVLMTEIARVLGESDDAKRFAKEAEMVRTMINEKLLDKAKGVYIDGEGSSHSSLHANMMPLVFGLVPDQYKMTVVDFIKTRGMACSVYGAQYLLEALYQAGETEYAFKLMTDTTTDRSWWNMIQLGATMTLEAWDMKYKPNLDWNHAWGTAPLNTVVRHLWGITPIQPGFKQVEVQPQLGELTFSEIKTPTIMGNIIARHQQVNEKVNYTIELPEGMSGIFIVPKGYQPTKSKQRQEIIKLSSEVNKIKLRVISKDSLVDTE
ncbi:alpha-L-rhamnosidase C-terminal domain-containing protein [Reichenbachiella sp. 5M10]|uniref:alpha-L-rhamnosidase-related protein n=1 Tax=Reichenbachiella sp. 5M10 TaxID=1889772 RepID=UPI001179ADA0|nr:alpha-L-rhamnosidase C-terminal domain-containing protein [Reichenbachiella sp. 5M10]